MRRYFRWGAYILDMRRYFRWGANILDVSKYFGYAQIFQDVRIYFEREQIFWKWADILGLEPVQGIGSSPIGDSGQFLYWLWPHYQHKPTLNMQTSFNPSSVASSLQHPCNNNVLRLFLPVSCTKSTINQKEWHVATKRLDILRCAHTFWLWAYILCVS